MPQITFISHDGVPKVIDAEVGLTVMQNAQRRDVPGIEAICGGGCACGTCHVYVEDGWFNRLAPAEQTEQDMLDVLTLKRDTSRLTCQITVKPELDGLVVHLPEYQE